MFWLSPRTASFQLTTRSLPTSVAVALEKRTFCAQATLTAQTRAATITGTTLNRRVLICLKFTSSLVTTQFDQSRFTALCAKVKKSAVSVFNPVKLFGLN